MNINAQLTMTGSTSILTLLQLYNSSVNSLNMITTRISTL